MPSDSIDISGGEARVLDDAELGKKRFDLTQRQVIFFLSVAIVVLLTIYSLGVVTADLMNIASPEENKVNWFYDLLKVLFGFVAGAIWPSTQNS